LSRSSRAFSRCRGVRICGSGSSSPAYSTVPSLVSCSVIGWANASVAGQDLRLDVGYVAGHPPRDRRFRRALADEHARLSAFLGLEN